MILKLLLFWIKDTQVVYVEILINSLILSKQSQCKAINMMRINKKLIDIGYLDYWRRKEAGEQ